MILKSLKLVLCAFVKISFGKNSFEQAWKDFVNEHLYNNIPSKVGVGSSPLDMSINRNKNKDAEA